jgi:hypothetical protein
VEVSEAPSCNRQSIEMGRRNLSPERAEIGKAEIVSNDQQDIRAGYNEALKVMP